MALRGVKLRGVKLRRVMLLAAELVALGTLMFAGQAILDKPIKNTANSIVEWYAETRTRDWLKGSHQAGERNAARQMDSLVNLYAGRLDKIKITPDQAPIVKKMRKKIVEANGLFPKVSAEEKKQIMRKLYNEFAATFVTPEMHGIRIQFEDLRKTPPVKKILKKHDYHAKKDFISATPRFVRDHPKGAGRSVGGLVWITGSTIAALRRRQRKPRAK